MNIKERITKILEILNQDIFEKEEAIRLSFLSIIAFENIFLMGKPGVAKSMIARRLKKVFKDAKSFEYLMNRFSTPDELFGPISIKKLKDEDKYQRNTTNYLPDCEIVFLDEIWKAGPSIQNSLLTIINEKVYRNGDKEEKAKLLGLIAASNELPEKELGLEALWDRFVIRYLVSRVSELENFNKLISEKIEDEIKIPDNIQININDLQQWQEAIQKISIPEEVFKVVQMIRFKLIEYNEDIEEGIDKIYVSDRRWRKIVKILKTSAFLNERQEVDLMDCFLIGHCIWDNPEQREDILDIVTSALKEHGYSLSMPTKPFESQIKEFKKEVKRETSIKKAVLRKELVKVDDKYEIIGLTESTSYNLIDIKDYKSLDETGSDTYLYASDGKSISSDLKLESGKLKIKHSNSWKEIFLKSANVTREEVTSNKPNPRLEKEWNKEVESIKSECDKCINQVKKYRNNKLSDLQSNLFIDKQKSTFVEENLHNTIQAFQKLKLDIERVKSKYEQLK